MTEQETLRKPIMPETGPRPLTASSEIKFNTTCLTTGKITIYQSKSTFSEMGFFRMSNKDYGVSLDSFLDFDPFWAPELLDFDPKQYSIQTTKHGNLGVYETKGETLIPEQQKPKIIVEAKDIRAVDSISCTMKGKVCSSGFVFPENLPPCPLGGGQRISPEELEQMLLTAEKNDKPQSYYHRHRGFAKVDPNFAGRNVSLIAFGFQYRSTGSPMLTDAVVIDRAERKLLPRVFYNLTPEKTT
jgi:hypothetical protein